MRAILVIGVLRLGFVDREDGPFPFSDNQPLFRNTIRVSRIMDRLDAMRVFARVVEQKSFSAAARDLGLPASTVTDAVKQLEARLGVKLLQRATRHVSPPLDGEAYYQRCLGILDEIEDAESAFSGAKPSGLLRIDAQGGLVRRLILPSLPGFFAEYPGIELYMSEGDRFVDLVSEGFDCVLRAGEAARRGGRSHRGLTRLHRALWPSRTLGCARRPSHDRLPLVGHRRGVAAGIHGGRRAPNCDATHDFVCQRGRKP